MQSEAQKIRNRPLAETNLISGTLSLKPSKPQRLDRQPAAQKLPQAKFANLGILTISIILSLLCSCEQNVRIEPDYSKHCNYDPNSESAWLYVIEKKINDQLAEKGFVEVYYTELYDLVAYGIRGTWTKDDDYWYTENIYLKIVDPEKAAPCLYNDCIYGNYIFKSPFRRALWWYNWSVYQDIAEQARDQTLDLYLEKGHKK